MKVTGKTLGVVVNAPEWYRRADFLAWLNSTEFRTATWHRPGEAPHDFSDVFVLVDSEYEGDSSEMPEDIWKALCDAAYEAHCYGRPNLHPFTTSHIVVRITNLDE
jgi:hypothetical protein